VIAVQGLTSVQVQAFYSRMLAEGIGPWTVRYCHQRLSQALKQAMRLGIVVRNVCEAVDPPRLPSHEMQTWDAAQARHGIARDRLFCVYGGRYDRAPLGTTPVRAYRHPWLCPLPFAYRNRAACR